MAIRVKGSNGIYDTLEAGFYGAGAEIYYVAPSGRVWIVASEDDLGTGGAPLEILPTDLPAAEAIQPLDDLLTPEEAIDHCRRIEAVSGEELIEA